MCGLKENTIILVKEHISLPQIKTLSLSFKAVCFKNIF